MKTNNTFAIMFLCRSNKKDNKEGLIYVRITVNGNQTEVSLKEKIVTAQWNVLKQQLNVRTPQIKAINTYIDDVRFKLREKYREMETKDITPTAQSIKDSFLGKSVKAAVHTICELMGYHFKMEGDKLRQGTMKNYIATEDYVKRFIASKFQKTDMSLDELNFEFLIELEYFIRNNPLKPHDPCLGNGVMKHLERVKKIVRWSRQLGWLKQDPFVDYKLSFQRSRRKKLDLTDLNAIENKTFSNKTLSYVKDLFLFSCYTGLAYADVIALKVNCIEKDNKGKLWCKIYRQKNDEYSPVPILNVATDLIEKYSSHPKALNSGTVFPYINVSSV